VWLADPDSLDYFWDSLWVYRYNIVTELYEIYLLYAEEDDKILQTRADLITLNGLNDVVENYDLDEKEWSHDAQYCQSKKLLLINCQK